MITMVRNGKKVKITKKQFRNYWLNVQARNEVKKDRKKGQ